MKSAIKPSGKVVQMFSIILIIITTGFFSTQVYAQNENESDVLSRHEKALAKAELEMKKAMEEVKRAQEKFTDQHLAEMKQKMAEAMQKIDREKLQTDIARAHEKIAAELKEVEVRVMDKDLQRKIQEELRAAMKGVERELARSKEEVQRELQRAKREIDMIDVQKEVKESLQKAELELAAAKEELAFTKEGFQELKKDGLIKPGDQKLEIEYRGDDLYINDKKQSKKASEKYSRYFKNSSKIIL